MAKWNAVSPNNYEARVTIRIGPDGKQMRKSLYGKTRQDVNTQMNELLSNLRKGIIINPTEMTLGEWLYVYMVDYKKPFVKPTTYINYMVRVNNHRGKLKALRPDMVQKFINGLNDAGLSSATVGSCYKTLNKALERALNDGLIVRNAAHQAKLPKLTQRAIEVLTREQ